MKKFVLFFVLLLTFGSTRASVADLFSVDKALISAEMTDLNELETFVLMNKEVSLTEVRFKNKLLAINVLSAEESPNSLASILQNSNAHSGGADSCMAVAVCACCVSSLIGGIYYYISYLAAIS